MPYIDQYVGGSDWQQQLKNAASQVFYPDAILRNAGLTTSRNNPTNRYQVHPTRPVIRMPDSFRYTDPVAAPRTTNTVDTDGATRLFGDLKDAAKETLLGSLDDALDRARGRGGSSPAITQASAPGDGVAGTGIPLGAVIATAVVGGLIYMKFG